MTQIQDIVESLPPVPQELHEQGLFEMPADVPAASAGRSNATGTGAARRWWTSVRSNRRFSGPSRMRLRLTRSWNAAVCRSIRPAGAYNAESEGPDPPGGWPDLYSWSKTVVKVRYDMVQCHVVRRAYAGGHEFLQLRRAAGDFMGGTWQNIYGGIREGETAWQAAIRELHEETGLKPLEFYQLDTVNTFYLATDDCDLELPGFLRDRGVGGGDQPERGA